MYKPLNSKLGLSFSFSQVEHDETMKEINDLKTSKATQSTDIPTKFFDIFGNSCFGRYNNCVSYSI